MPVDQLVGKDTALEIDVGCPIDVGGRVPLIALGVLVEAAQVGSFDRVVALEGGIE